MAGLIDKWQHFYDQCQKRKSCFRCDSAYLGWFEGVVCWKMNCQEENSSLIWTVALKARTTFTYISEKNDLKAAVHSFSLSSQISTFITWIHLKQPRAQRWSQISTSWCFKVRREQHLCHKVSTYRSHDCGLPVKHCKEQKVNFSKADKGPRYVIWREDGFSAVFATSRKGNFGVDVHDYLAVLNLNPPVLFLLSFRHTYIQTYLSTV